MKEKVEKENMSRCRFLSVCKRRPELLTGFMFSVVVIAFLFFFEVTREFIGVAYNMNLATMSINMSVLSIFAFFSPVLYLLGLARFDLRLLFLGSGIVFALCRVAMAITVPVAVYLLLTVLSIVSFGIFLPALILKFRQQYPTIGIPSLQVAVAVTAAAGVDLVFRVLGNTFDVSIYGITAQRLGALVVVIPAAILFLISLVMWHCAAENSQPSDEEKSQPKSSASKFRSLLGCGIGAMFFLYSGFLAYPNSIARWVEGSYSLTAVLFGAVLGGFVLVSLLSKPAKWLVSKTGLTIGSFVILIALIIYAFVNIPSLVIVLIALAVFFLPVLLVGVLDYLLQPHVNIRQIASFFTVAAAALVPLLLLSVFTLTWAFVPGMGFLRDQMGTLLVVALILLLLGTAGFRYRASEISRKEAVLKNRILIAIFGVLVITGTSAGVAFYQIHPEPVRPDTLKVMTYNIHQGFDTEGRITPWTILEPIQRVSPDILALQESDMNRLSSTNVDIVQWLAYKLDMYVYFGPQTKYQIYGVAILSKFPLDHTETHYLPSIEDQRVLVRADIQWNDQTLSVYAVHMGLSEEDRTNQASEILEILSQNTNSKILMGDLNSLPDSKQIDAFLKVLGDSWVIAGHNPTDPLGYTLSSLEPYERIDYILVSQEFACVLYSEVIRGVYGSDHLPYWAEIM
jgi:endonuclease/exonuclease/phosphatase family metal-dependent hydrolase